ncbi:hypothetical protein ACLOJK_023800 [Asimina triloba]
MGMGNIRSFNFHILPYCFHLIYNRISCINLSPSSSPSAPTPTINLIRSDGHVTIYHSPTPASLPMRQFPKHLICDSDSFFLGQPIPALSASDTLQLGRNYFLLPSHLFQSVLSFLTLTSFASQHHAFKSPTRRRPFDILKTASGSVQIRVSDEFIQSLMIGKEHKDDDGEAGKKRLCSTPELEKDYQMLVVGGKRFKDWKPKLETIEEKERRKIGGGGFGMRKKKKSSHSQSQASRSATKEL